MTIPTGSGNTSNQLSELLDRAIMYSYSNQKDISNEITAYLKNGNHLEQPLLIDLQIYALSHENFALQGYCFARISNFGIRSQHGHDVFDWAARFNRVDFFKTCYLLNPKKLTIKDSTLYQAIRSFSVDVVQFLCDHKLCDVNCTNQDQTKSPLHIALKRFSYAKDDQLPKALKMITLLIDHGADLAPFNQGSFPNWLHLITDERRLESLPISVLDTLMNCGCSVDALDLHWQIPPILEKYRLEKTQRKKKIATFFARIKDQEIRAKVFRLFLKALISKDDFSLFKYTIETLSEQGVNVMMENWVWDSDQSKSIYTLIPLASYLLINRVDQKYLTYLMPSKPNFKDDVLARIEEGGRKRVAICPLTSGVHEGSAEFVEILLTDPKYRRFPEKINTECWPSRGFYPIHIAAERGDPKVIKLLLNKKANIDQLNTQGRAPIHILIESSKNHTEALSLIIKRGANVNIPNMNGMTPLESGSSRLSSTTCRDLILRGALLTQVIVEKVLFAHPDLSSLVLAKYKKPLFFANFDVHFPSKKPEKAIDIPGNAFHMLASKPDQLDEKAKEMRANVLRARVVLVASDIAHKKGGDHRRKIFAIPIHTYEKALHIKDFYKKIQDNPPRYEGFLEDVLKATPKEDHQKIIAMHQSHTDAFHRTYHCSEWSLYKHLMKEEVQQRLVKEVESRCPNRSPLKFYAIVIDVHSTRYLCATCEKSIPLMYGPKSRFTKNLSDLIKKREHLLPSKTLRTLVRFSAKGPGKGQPLIKKEQHIEEWKQLDLKRYSNPENMAIMQATSSVLSREDLPETGFSSHQRLTKDRE